MNDVKSTIKNWIWRRPVISIPSLAVWIWGRIGGWLKNHYILFLTKAQPDQFVFVCRQKIWENRSMGGIWILGLRTLIGHEIVSKIRFKSGTIEIIIGFLDRFLTFSHCRLSRKSWVDCNWFSSQSKGNGCYSAFLDKQITGSRLVANLRLPFVPW